MSESNWRAPAEKPSSSPRDDAAAADEQRPGLEQVAGGRGRERVAAVDRHARARDVDAGAQRAPRRRRRRRGARDAARAQLAQRRLDGPAGAHEEPADERLGDAVARRTRPRAASGAGSAGRAPAVRSASWVATWRVVAAPSASRRRSTRRCGGRRTGRRTQDVAADLRQRGRRHARSVPPRRAPVVNGPCPGGEEVVTAPVRSRGWPSGPGPRRRPAGSPPASARARAAGRPRAPCTSAAPPAARATTRPPPGAGRGRRIAALVAAGVLLVALVVGVALALRSKHAPRAPRRGRHPGRRRPREGAADPPPGAAPRRRPRRCARPRARPPPSACARGTPSSSPPRARSPPTRGGAWARGELRARSSGRRAGPSCARPTRCPTTACSARPSGASTASRSGGGSPTPPAARSRDFGYPYVTALSFTRFTWTFCRNTPPQGERGVALAHVRLDRACLAATGRVRGTGYEDTDPRP